ncbi:DUF3558 domain-containing protein [Streptoalloteichus hindustanus]|uniref:DUF3558 domain-containing protein n=1 Tax=Streptoalloteichus hindustanus TaxID=2017 RepID=A0A1M5PHK6_STRHI|nr:DUF3558 domain-containing protein [Streptoalloteichus hindustanus]SHH01208.1 Protein of unknown function [Streptoalloteichus hindustanus]
MRGLLIISTALIAQGVVGCTSTTSGQAPTSSPPQSSVAASTTAAVDVVPKVTKPKNLKAIADACQLLSPQQLQELGASQPRPDKSPWGEGTCTWRNDNLNVHLAPDTTQGKGLAIAYANRRNNSEATTVNGHPGLRSGKESMSCGLWIGASDTQALSISLTVLRDVKPEYKDRCAFAEKVAGMVLSNLPAAS